jgi:DNA mismatch endonuclease (patch repair protein)
MVPATNKEFWHRKIADNRSRDAANCRKLRDRGFTVIIVWECQLRRKEQLSTRLKGRLPE